MIITCYSYKGGVGRTQLCANIAAYLCFQKGKKVLLWDWDFEAPGLHFYFNKKREDINKDGTLELLEDYVGIMEVLPNVKKENLPYITKEHIIPIEESQEPINENGEKGKIDLIAAGNYNKCFEQRVNSFDWLEFYGPLDGVNYMELVKKNIKELGYDYIIVDSRTGISDYSGLCNIQLPDINIMVMIPNNQNFTGCKRIAEQIQKSEYVVKGHRKPYIMPVLSRLDRSHPKFNEWVKKFIEEFAFLLPTLDKELDTKFTAEIFGDVYLQDTFLEYVHSISAGENIFIPREQTRLSRVAFERSFVNIADYLEKIKENEKINISKHVDKESWLAYAEKAKKEGKNEKAAYAYAYAEEYKESIKCGGSPLSYYEEGMRKYFQTDYKEAINNLDKALEMDDKFWKAWKEKGIMHYTLKEYDKAIECYLKTTEIIDDKVEVWYNLGLAYIAKEEYDKAIESLNKALTIKPNYYKALNNKGVASSRIEQYDIAEDCYKKAVELKPKHCTAFMNLGYLYFKQGKLDKAKKELEKSIKLGCKDIGNLNLGHVFWAGINKEKAIDYYKKSLEHFNDKEQFWKGFEEDMPYLKTFGITEADYENIKKKLGHSSVNVYKL